MAIPNLASAPVLRPSRLNAAGRCVYCLVQECDSASCIRSHARALWDVCDRCGGTEYVNGHVDPDTSSQRCDCISGLIEVTPAGFSVVDDDPESVEPLVVYESWPAGGGAPVRWTGRCSR